MIKFIIWFISLIIFSWCYSTIILSLLFINKAPHMKISLLIYIIITIGLYLLSYFFLRDYLIDIIICSVIAFAIALITPNKTYK